MSRKPHHNLLAPDGPTGLDERVPVLRFAGVGMRYGREEETLRDVSFELRAGSFHFLTGPSGAGKSSLLTAMAGLWRPERCAVTLDGEDLAGLAPERRGVGVVFQDGRLFPHLDVERNLRFGMGRAGRFHAPVASFDDVVGLLGLAALLGRRVRIPAREIILAHQDARDLVGMLSLHNVLSCEVLGLNEVGREVWVGLAAGQDRLVAKVTADAVARLDLCVGARVLALVKSVSVAVTDLRGE